MIVKSCDGMERTFALRRRARLSSRVVERAAAAAIGLPVLIAVNIVRICTLYYVGIHLPEWFEFAHLELWPLLFIAVAAFTFVGSANWMKTAVSPPSAPTRRKTE